MRGYYGSLYQTPYLYNSSALKRYFEHARSEDEVKAIKHHMERYEVYDQKEYAGYMAVTRLIQEEFYEEEAVEWDSIKDLYTPFVAYDGTIRLKPNSKSLIGSDADDF